MRTSTMPVNRLRRAAALFEEHKVEAAVCRSSFEDFVRAAWHLVVPEKLQWNWHLRYICRKLQRMAERVFKGLPKLHDVALNISPGTSKSTVCSVLFPAWVWTRMPSARFICCSYSERLALRLSRLCRDVIKSEWYQKRFPLSLRPDQDTKASFANTAGGERFAVGSNGSVIGQHGHFIIIDDPLDPDAAVSESELDSVNRWIKETLSSRKVDKKVTVTFLIMQRLHQDDPSAVAAKSPTTMHIKIPATDEFEIYPPALARYYKYCPEAGCGLMDPVRLPYTVLQEVKSGPRGDYVYAGQYGQDPVPPGGGMFKTKLMRVGVAPPKFKDIVRYWDKAGTLGGGAYTVGVKMGLDYEGRVWVLDVVRVQLDSFQREKLIRHVARQDTPRITVGLEQEPGSGGKESVENTTRRLLGFKVRVLKPQGSKEARADTFSVQVNAGNVWLCHGGWVEDYLEELKHFPFSTYKDQVDASAGAFTVLTAPKLRVGGITPGKHFKDTEITLAAVEKRRKLLAESRPPVKKREIPGAETTTPKRRVVRGEPVTAG